MHLFRYGLACGAAAILVCPAARADGPAIHGSVFSTYGHNGNDPPSRTNGFRVFDTSDRDFGIDAEVVLERAASATRRAGFRLDVMAGSTIPQVAAAAGLFRDDAGTAEDLDLQQAFVSYLAPVGDGLRIDVGKFTSHMGYEAITGYDALNDNVTRSFLFGWAVPFTQTGVRIAYSFGPRFNGTVFVLNGWDNVRDNNRRKSLGAQASVTFSDGFTATLNYLGGPERADNDEDDRRVLDLCASYQPSDRWSFGLNADVGREENAVPGDDARWDGAALYARAALGAAFSLALRAERFRDEDGARTGTPQTLDSLTLTPALRLSADALVRLDLRLDRSSAPVFESERGPEWRQPTVTAEAIVTF